MSHAKTSTGDRLDLADIQGNVLTAYGKQGFPKGRFITLHVSDPVKGRQFLRELFPHITTALRWPSRKDSAPPPSVAMPDRPHCTLNLAFTFWGLFALKVPLRTLDGMPDEFVDGMRARASIVGDNLPDDALSKWDEAWAQEDAPMAGRAVHILVTLNSDMNPSTGEPVPAMDDMTRLVRDACDRSEGGVEILGGHGPTGEEYQELSAVLDYDEHLGRYVPTAREHFGFFDGIGDPVFEGQYPEDTANGRVVGNGKLSYDSKGNEVWQPLKTGEFLLGYRDEASELPVASSPKVFSRNGTFMAYRKLYENVDAFERYIDETAPEFGRIYGIEDLHEARETLMAKFAGRWSDGVPLSLAPTFADWQEFNATNTDAMKRYGLLSDFTFQDDKDGAKCPASSHIRRVNPRGALGPRDTDGSTLTNRRRILRRGLPYEEPAVGGGTEKGIVMLVCCANLQRQFEFVQQQWLNYGMDNDAGNDTCPLLGNRPGKDVKFVIPGDSENDQPPFFCSNLPQFVETRGGAYFFVPSMSAIKMVALGMIDPT